MTGGKMKKLKFNSTLDHKQNDGLAIFYELLEQPKDLLGNWRDSTSCKTA